MKNQFAETYAQLPETKLREVLLRQGDYVREAIWAAELELGRRGIPPEELQKMKSDGQRQKVAAQEKAEIPLEFKWQAAYFLGAPLLFSPFVWMFYRRYGEKGYDRKSYESMQAVFLGVLFYAAVAGTVYRIF